MLGDEDPDPTMAAPGPVQAGGSPSGRVAGDNSQKAAFGTKDRKVGWVSALQTLQDLIEI